MNDSELDGLVATLRVNFGSVSVPTLSVAADAITALRADRDALRARVAEVEEYGAETVDALDAMGQMYAEERTRAEAAEARVKELEALLRRAYDALGEDMPLHKFNRLAFDMERALATPTNPAQEETK